MTDRGFLLRCLVVLLAALSAIVPSSLRAGAGLGCRHDQAAAADEDDGDDEEDDDDEEEEEEDDDEDKRRPKRPPPRPEGPNLALPKELPEALRKTFADAIAEFKKVRDGEGKTAELRNALRRLERAHADDPNSPVLLYYLGQAHQLKRGFLRARSLLERAVKLKPDFHEAQLELGDVCVWEREPEKALAAYDKALEIAPKYVEAHIQKAYALLRLGRFKESIATFGKAEKIEPQPDLAMMKAFIQTEIKGPAWSKTYTKETDNYRVYTSVSQALADEVASRAELILKAYKRIFPKIKRPDRKFPIYIYDNREAYVRAGNPPVAAGHYSPLVRKLVFYKQPKSQDTFMVLQHEAFHQFLDDYCDLAPQWFNEGLGDFYGAYVYEKKGKKEFLHRRPNAWRLDTIKFAIQSSLCPSVEELMTMSQQEMYSPRMGIHYAQAWSLIYFMFETAEQYHYDKVLENYFNAMVAGKDIEEAFAATFGRIDMTKFELSWKAYITGLKSR